MAAHKTLDPTTCTTTAEAFKYPLPQVRQFHRTLTSELDEKNARLRTLVGGSYRQLLGTAEMILQMRDDIGHVEEKLGRVGKGCGRGVVGGMATGLAKLQENGRGGKDAADLEWCARMKVLDTSALTVGRLMRKSVSGGKNLVLAAKVLVLSRLLVKSVEATVSQRRQHDREAVDEIKKKLKVLRGRLEKAVDRTLENIGDNRDDLIQALCAYSLATNYGAKDVLRHFLDVRGQAMTLCFDDDNEQKGEASVVRALELYTKTLLDVQELVPRRLSEALASLKSKPLLKDQSVRDQEGLHLDVCEKWFGDEILFFMPYIRHDDLEGPNAVIMLRKWANEASNVMLQGFAKTLDQTSEFKAVVDLRTKIFQIWIKEGGKPKGFDASILLDGFRKVVNERLVELLESRVTKLHLVSTGIEARLGSWQSGLSDKQESLWDPSMLEMEISNGATLFRQGIIARTYGRNEAVSNAYQGYQTWRRLVDEIIVVVEQLKKQKWDDDLQDIEDELSLESRSILLSTDDPQMLQETLDSGLESAYKELHEKIGSLLTTYQESSQIGQISVYLLRIIRDIRSELPKNSSLKQFGLSLIPTLHNQLALTISSSSVRTFTKSLTKKKLLGRALWEGTPELPVQPSPAAFKLLHNLSVAMARTGSDLWSPSAIIVLKQHLQSQIATQWHQILTTQKAQQTPQATREALEESNTTTEPKKENDENATPTPMESQQPPSNSTPQIQNHPDNTSGQREKISPNQDSTFATVSNSHLAKSSEPSPSPSPSTTPLPNPNPATQSSSSEPSPNPDRVIQSIYDIHFLQTAFAIPEGAGIHSSSSKSGSASASSSASKSESDSSSTSELRTVVSFAELERELEREVELCGSIGLEEKKRLSIGAREFWGRVGLLFGVVSCG